MVLAQYSAVLVGACWYWHRVWSICLYIRWRFVRVPLTHRLRHLVLLSSRNEISECQIIIFTLLGPGIQANTRTSALKKLDFSSYEFGIGHYAFYPMKLSGFAERKIKFHQKYQNFIFHFLG